jgi:hypothetical protein
VILPDPEPGLVISYAYLWLREQKLGRAEGAKDRPCVIILAAQADEKGATRITAAPVTHVMPRDPARGIELPQAVKRSLGLDHERSWVMVDEVNHFIWPGYDLRPIRSRDDRVAYGFIPPGLYRRIVTAILARVAARRIGLVRRD